MMKYEKEVKENICIERYKHPYLDTLDGNPRISMLYGDRPVHVGDLAKDSFVSLLNCLDPIRKEEI